MRRNVNHGGASPGLSPEERRLQVRKIEELGGTLVNFGVKVVKRNPGKFSLYAIGLCLCLFFSGHPVNEDAYRVYDQIHRQIDYSGLYDAEDSMLSARYDYERRKGWFWSCNDECQEYKKKYDSSARIFQKLNQEKIDTIREANSQIGILSTQGIRDTRDRFWQSFNGGKRFATRQSKWDAFFMGLGALQKNEKIGSYLLRVLINFVFNFSIGVFMALLQFWYTLWGLMVEYKASIMTCSVYLVGAILASLSFAASFLLILYIGAAGTVYVGAKVLSTSVRIENDPDRNHLRGD